MKKFRNSILLIAISFIFCGCPENEEIHRNIAFVNNSDVEIVCQALVSGNISEKDTLFHCRTGAVGISSNSQHNFSSLHNSWEIDFEIIPYIQLLVMDSKIYDNYIAEPCDTIRKYVPILKRYRLTLSDLRQMNWVVEYPSKDKVK